MRSLPTRELLAGAKAEVPGRRTQDLPEAAGMQMNQTFTQMSKPGDKNRKAEKSCNVNATLPV